MDSSRTDNSVANLNYEGWVGRAYRVCGKILLLGQRDYKFLNLSVVFLAIREAHFSGG